LLFKGLVEARANALPLATNGKLYAQLNHSIVLTAAVFFSAPARTQIHQIVEKLGVSKQTSVRKKVSRKLQPGDWANVEGSAAHILGQQHFAVFRQLLQRDELIGSKFIFGSDALNLSIQELKKSSLALRALKAPVKARP